MGVSTIPKHWTLGACVHPPREWYRGMLLPCADPSCPHGSPGTSYNFLSEDTGGAFTIKTFDRHVRVDADGEVYSWEQQEPKPVKRTHKRKR